MKKSRITQAMEFTYSGRPSSFITLWQACKPVDNKLPPGEKPIIPEIRTRWDTAEIDMKHLTAYSKICGITSAPSLPVLYPLMLIYPFNLRIMSLKEIPMPMFRMLNKRTLIKAFRPISANDPLDIVCEVSDSRIVKKGLEVDIRSIVSSRNNPVWECVKTFYFRGNFGNPDHRDGTKRICAIEEGTVLASWYLPAGKGLHFAKISGDSNGLHYSRQYARFMGFERDFAQPMLITGKCLEILGKSHNSKAICIDFSYKGQVYYQRQLTLHHQLYNQSERFDLYCEGNERPCICGEITYL